MIKYGVFVSCYFTDYQNSYYDYNFESKYTYTDYMVYVCILFKFIKMIKYVVFIVVNLLVVNLLPECVLHGLTPY